MKRFIFLLIILSATQIAFGQQKQSGDKAEIKKVITTFMNCFVKKDSEKFYSLFHSDPIVWIGVFKDKTQQDRLKKDSSKKNFFAGTYQSFYKSISDSGADEEKFYNINITNDESVAAVMFDYSSWEKGKNLDWGKESWHLVKIAGQWKIVGVIFSIEFENVNPEANRK